MCCSLFVIRCLLRVGCLLVVVCSLLVVVGHCCLSFAVCPSLLWFIVYGSLCVVCCLMVFGVCCWRILVYWSLVVGCW